MQDRYDVRFEWGRVGAAALAPSSSCLVVDVLSFSTSVTVAVEADRPWSLSPAAVGRFLHERVLPGEQGALGAVAVIAAGERWPDGSLRPALEDLLGAGMVIAALAGCGVRVLSPEAEAARACFEGTADIAAAAAAT